jgi:hypothetical protein
MLFMLLDLTTVKMNVPDWVQEVLSTFEHSAKPHIEVDIADALRNASKAHEDMPVEDFKGYHAEWAAFLFLERPEEDSAWGTYFAPMMTAQQEDGSEYRSPDIKNLDVEAVAYWLNRAESVRDPMMRARYADLVWDLKKVITGEKRPYDCAQIAIEAYLESTQKALYTHPIHGVHWLRRALSLSLSIADKERTGRVVDVILDFCERVATTQAQGIWIFPFDALYSKKGLLTPEQEAKVIGDLEAMLLRTAGNAKSEEFNPDGAQAAAERLAQHYKIKNDRLNVERVIKAAGESFERLAAETSPMLAMAWLQPVIERYEQEGLKQDAERVQLLSAEKGKNIASDLKEFAVKVEIKKGEIDEQVESLIGSGDLKTSLMKIAQTFIPRPKEAREVLEKMRKDAPLLSIFKIGIIEKDGHTAATIGSLDEDPEGRLHRQLGEFINFDQPFLSISLGKLRDRYKPSVDDILDFLCETPLFIPFRDGLLREALEAYEKGDFVKTIHVLVPQIEHVLRDLLGQLGVPTLKTVRNHPGIMDAKSMNDILSDERMREALTESLWRYFTVLYIDKKGGFNLRNDLAHGLLPPSAFNREMTDRVFHSLLALSLTRPKKRTAGTENTVIENDQTESAAAESPTG